MKIIDIKKIQVPKLKTDHKKLRHGAAVVGVLLMFFIILNVLRYQTSPDSVTADKAASKVYSVVDSAGGTYYGAVENALYVGEGTFQYVDGSVYSGEFGNSQRSGKGTLTWPNGDVFTGTWTDDVMTSGTYTFDDGRFFTGTFKDNKWENGYYSLGPAMNAEGFTEFAAEIADGNVSTLVFTMNDGTHYNGHLDGYAEIRYANGNTYVGNVDHGKRYKYGKFTFAASGARYEGEWNNDLMEGTGTYSYGAENLPYITGTFKAGKLEGEATYHNEAGKTFKTSWTNGVCVNNNK